MSLIQDVSSISQRISARPVVDRISNFTFTIINAYGHIHDTQYRSRLKLSQFSIGKCSSTLRYFHFSFCNLGMELGLSRDLPFTNALLHER